MQIERAQLASRFILPIEPSETSPSAGAPLADDAAIADGMLLDATALERAIDRRRTEIDRLESGLKRLRQEAGALVEALAVLRGNRRGQSAVARTVRRLTAPATPDEAKRARERLKTAVRKALRRATLFRADLGEGFTARHIADLMKTFHPHFDLGRNLAFIANCLQEFAAEGTLVLIRVGRGPTQAVYRHKENLAAS